MGTKDQNQKSASVGTAVTEAQQIIESAKQRALEIVAKAKVDYQKAIETGYEQGFEKGKLEASISAVRLIEDSTSVNKVIAEEAAKLALAICGKVIEEQARVSDEFVRKLAERGIKEAIIGDSVTILVHPDDRQLLENEIESLKKLANGASVVIVSKDDLTRGGCIVRTELGEIDATVDSFVQTVAKALGLSKGN